MDSGEKLRVQFTFYCSSIKGMLTNLDRSITSSFTFYCSSIKG